MLLIVLITNCMFIFLLDTDTAENEPEFARISIKNLANPTSLRQDKPEAMYTESAFRREELEGSGGEKQPEEGMESAEFLSAGMRFVIRSDWHSFYV